MGIFTNRDESADVHAPESTSTMHSSEFAAAAAGREAVRFASHTTLEAMHKIGAAEIQSGINAGQFSGAGKPLPFLK